MRENASQFINRKQKQSTRPQQNSIHPRRSISDLIENKYLRPLFKSGTHIKTKSAHLFSELCMSDFLNCIFDQFCKTQYKDIVKKQCPYNKAHLVCKEMDISGGVLNQSSINHLRRIEGLGKYGQNGYMCSMDKIKKCSKLFTTKWKNCVHK